MAGIYNKRPPFDPRAVLKNTLVQGGQGRGTADPKRRVNMASKVSDMSPEARKAMLLAKEDSKENNALKSSHRTSVRSNRQITNTTTSKSKVNDENNNSNDESSNHADIKSSDSTNNNASTTKPKPAIIITPRGPGPRSREPPRSRNVASSFGAKTEATARSRSTLSHTDKTYSMSDHNDSCYNYGNRTKDRGRDYAPSSLYNNESNGDDDHNNSRQMNIEETQYDDDGAETEIYDEDSESKKNNDDDSDDKGEQAGAEEQKPKSFVLALDKALEENSISRLRGDITDITGISEPGKVRALDGGRLTNAQEVVVNVCHEDDRELVFHDDDVESLDNAKTISQIRVNIWMEYNEEFQPDNGTDDLDFSVGRNDEADDGDADNVQRIPKSKLSVPAGGSNNTIRGRDNTKHSLTNKKPLASPRSVSRSKAPGLRRDKNNNSSASLLSKDSSGTRINSAVSTDGSRRSGNSSGKRESYLKQKVKA